MRVEGHEGNRCITVVACVHHRELLIMDKTSDGGGYSGRVEQAQPVEFAGPIWCPLCSLPTSKTDRGRHGRAVGFYHPRTWRMSRPARA